VHAQTKLWDKTIGGNHLDNLAKMQQTRDGGYILGGYSTSGKSADKSEANKGQRDVYGDLTNDYWVVKLKADGSKEWDKTFGGNSEDQLTSVQQTSDGGYILGGYSRSGISGDKSEANKGEKNEEGFYFPDYWIVKLKADGSKEWDKTFGGSDVDWLTSLQQTSDGGYILGGTSSSGISGDKTEAKKASDENFYTTDYWIVKLDANGAMQWDKTLGGENTDQLASVLQTSDGGYILGGWSVSRKSGDKTGKDSGFDNSDYWVVKLDANGKKLWDKTLGGKGNDDLSAVQQTLDGGYLLGGSTLSNKSGDKTEINRGGYDYWVVKLKADGSKEWDKTFGGDDWDYLNAVQQTSDSGYILGGRSRSGKSRDKTEGNKGNKGFSYDYWMVKLKADGTKVWDKTIGGTGEENLNSLQQTSDGHYILGGGSASGISGDKSEENKGVAFGSGDPTWDYWVVKIEESGKQEQTISINPILPKSLSDAPFTVSARASSGLPVSFRIIAGPATIKDSTVTLTGTGKVYVQATQAGNAVYLPAKATRAILVDPSSTVKQQWEKTVGGNSWDYLVSVQQTPDGGHILSGTSGSSRSGDKTEPNSSIYFSDYWLVKLRADGTKEWDKTITAREGDYISTFRQTRDGGYILGGPFDQGESRGWDYGVIKLRADGTKEWNKTFGGSGYDWFHSMEQTSDGGYILAGYSDTGIEGDKTEANKGQSNFWLVKIKANGSKEWDKTIGGTYIDGFTQVSVQQTFDGGYIVGGDSYSGKGGDKSEANRGDCQDEGCTDYWVVKLNAKGAKEWDKTLGGKDTDTFSAIQQSSDGGYIVGGYSYSNKSGDKTEHSKGGQDYWVVKLRANGSKEWDKTIGSNGEDYLALVHPTSDGGFILGGTAVYSTKSGDKTQVSRDNPDYQEGDWWIVKLQADGAKVWDKTYGGRREDIFRSLQPTNDGGYILGGWSASGKDGDKSEANRGSYDYWVVKLKEEQPTAAQWNMRYGGSGKDNFTDAIETLDGGYLAGGFTNSGGNGDKSQATQGQNDYWIVKSDQNGKKLWEKRYGGTEDDYLNRIIQTSDGGYLLAGSSFSGKGGDKTEASQGERDYWVVKVDKQGTKEWDKTFGGNDWDELKKVIQLASGEYVLGGSSNSPVSGDKSQRGQGGHDYWLVKISSTGMKLWDKRYGGSADELLGGFTETADGGFFLGGSSLSGQSGDKSLASRGSSDYWLVKTDKDGALLWEESYGGSGQDEVYSVRRSHGNNLYVAGTSNSGIGVDKSQKSQGGKDYWLIKLDENGYKLWDKTFGGSKDDELHASTFTDEGHYILAGHSYSGASGNKSFASQGSSDYWVVEVAPSGKKIADQRFGGSDQEELRTVFQTNDGSLLLGGRSDSGVSGDRSQPSQGSTDYWLVKAAALTTAMPLVAAREATLAEEPITKVNLLQAYPNPVRDQATISFTLPEKQFVQLKVYDSQGKEEAILFQGEAQAHQTYQVEWRAKDKGTGMYLLQLQTPTKRYQQKLLLAK